MRFCSKYNYTIAFFEFPSNPHLGFDEKKKEFSGKLRWLVDNYLLLKKKNEKNQDLLKYCNFIRTKEDGHLLANKTWSGSIGLVERGIADLNMRPSSSFILSDGIVQSSVFGDQQLLIGHFIKPKNTSTNTFDASALTDILIPSFSVFSLCSGLILFTWLISFLIYLISTRQYLSKKNLIKYIRFLNSKKKLPSINILFLFYLFYLFFIRNFVSNQINSMKVVVDKSILLYDNDQIKSTNLECCFFENSKIIEHLKFSTKSSIGYYIYKHLFRNKNCFLMNTVYGYDYGDNFFVLFVSFFQPWGMRMMANIKNYKQDIFINANYPIDSVPAVFYISTKTHKTLKMEIDQWCLKLLEQGFAKQGYSFIQFIMEMEMPSKNNLYQSLNEYLDSGTVISDLDFEKIKIFYYLYILIVSITLIIKLIQFYLINLFK